MSNSIWFLETYYVKSNYYKIKHSINNCCQSSRKKFISRALTYQPMTASSLKKLQHLLAPRLIDCRRWRDSSNSRFIRAVPRKHLRGSNFLPRISPKIFTDSHILPNISQSVSKILKFRPIIRDYQHHGKESGQTCGAGGGAHALEFSFRDRRDLLRPQTSVSSKPQVR